MEDVTVQCPYCFEVMTLELEPDETGAFVQDCEVCCRPWTVRVTRDASGEPSVVIGRS